MDPRTPGPGDPQVQPTAADYLDPLVSVYQNVNDISGHERVLRQVLQDIYDGSTSGRVEEVAALYPGPKPSRDSSDYAEWKEREKVYRQAKEQLPAVTFAGVFKVGHRHDGRPQKEKHLKQFPDCAGTGLKQHSKCCVVDFDHIVHNPHKILAVAASLPFVIGAFISPSRDGIKVVCALAKEPASDDEHGMFWDASQFRLVMAFQNAAYPVITDESGKNLSRLCFWGHPHPLCYIAPDDKPIQPIVVDGPQPDPQVLAALAFLVEQKIGEDDNALVGVGMCMKSMGHAFEEWDIWAESAGCTCTDRSNRWASFNGRDNSYGAIIGIAKRAGWTPGGASQTGKKVRQTRSTSSALHVGKGSNGLMAALQKLGMEIRFNIRAYKPEVRSTGDAGEQIIRAWGRIAETQPNGWTLLNPPHSANLRELIGQQVSYPADNGQRYPLHFSIDQWREAISSLSAVQYADPFEEWVDELPEWNGEDLWTAFFTEGYGVVPGEHYSPQYLAHGAKLILLPCIGRLYVPGIEASTMAVLIGEEGGGKSMGIQALFPPEWLPRWFSDSTSLSDTKQELVETTRGFVLIELSELIGATTQDQRRLKQKISSRWDVVRLAFREDAQSFPRAFHWVGTANPEEGGVLPDATKNRRYWPVQIPDHRSPEQVMDWFDRHRDQLWAMGVAEYRATGLQGWLNPKNLMGEHRAATETQRSSPEGVEYLVDAIEDINREELAAGISMAEMLYRVGAFGGAVSSVAEVAAKLSSGPGSTLSRGVGTELRRRGWERRPSTVHQTRGRKLWFPPR